MLAIRVSDADHSAVWLVTIAEAYVHELTSVPGSDGLQLRHHWVVSSFAVTQFSNMAAIQKVALITAGTAGLGAQIARVLAPDFRVVRKGTITIATRICRITLPGDQLREQ